MSVSFLCITWALNCFFSISSLLEFNFCFASDATVNPCFEQLRKNFSKYAIWSDYLLANNTIVVFFFFSDRVEMFYLRSPSTVTICSQIRDSTNPSKLPFWLNSLRGGINASNISPCFWSVMKLIQFFLFSGSTILFQISLEQLDNSSFFFL